MLPQALTVMKGWGFDYKTHCVWNKDRVGTGYWFRNKHELVLIGTKGSPPAPAPGTQFPSVLDAPVGAHSAKPDIILQMIEAYFPNLPKIELNRRGPPRPGWDAWGNEAEAPADARVTDDQIADHSPCIDSEIEPAEQSAEEPATDHQSQPSPAIPSIEEINLDIPDAIRRDERNHAPFMGGSHEPCL